MARKGLRKEGGPSPHYLGHRRRLRERFLNAGFHGFAPHEVLELLLTLAIPRKDVKAPAKTLLARFGTLRGVLDAPVGELREVTGLGEVAPVALRIMRETANLYLQQRAEDQPSLIDQESLILYWRSRLGGYRYEVFEVAYLDSSRRLMRDGVETLAEGVVDRATVYPRRVMEAALRRGAAAVILAHNHPNGNVMPSKQDKLLTKALDLAATTLQVEVHDHLVVTADDAFSFREAGLL